MYLLYRQTDTHGHAQLIPKKKKNENEHQKQKQKRKKMKQKRKNNIINSKIYLTCNMKQITDINKT